MASDHNGRAQGLDEMVPDGGHVDEAFKESDFRHDIRDVKERTWTSPVEQTFDVSQIIHLIISAIAMHFSCDSILQTQPLFQFI